MRLCLLLLILGAPQTSTGISSLVLSSSGSDQGKAVSLSCKDENNNNVDWYILYKSPRSQNYIYISNNGQENTKKLIGASDGVLANTLRPMFEVKTPDSFGFLSYSDQPPNKTPGSNFGHSKGVVLGDSKAKTALWLTHSTPKFPFCRNLEDFWPESGNRNGQTFMCVTLKFNQLQAIGTHLQNIRAFTFKSKIPCSFPQEIKDASNNNGHAPTYTVFQELRVGKKDLLVVAKKTGKTAAEGDLYVQLRDHFQSDVNAKTWGCQQNNDESYCKGQYKVLNVESVQTSLGVWSYTQDHSKWAITTNNNNPWTCIADMNRAESQYKRPGGALCINDKKVTEIFRGFVKDTLPCRKRPRPCNEDDDDDEMMDLNVSFEKINMKESEGAKTMTEILQRRKAEVEQGLVLH